MPRFGKLLLLLLLSLPILHAQEAEASNTTATSTETETAPAPPPKKEKPLKDKVNDFFGEHIVTPMWKYFLGFSVKDTTVISYKSGEPLKHRDGTPVLDVPKPKMVTKNGKRVPVLDENGDIVYNKPQQILSNPKAVLLNGKQIKVKDQFNIVLVNGAPYRSNDGSLLVLSEDELKHITFSKDQNGDIDKTLPVKYKGKPLNNSSGAPIIGKDISYLTAFDKNVTLDQSGNPILSINGQTVPGKNNNPIPLSEVTSVTVSLPFIVLILAMGGLFFTFRFGFINVRLFKHAIDCIRGKFDNPEDDGEVSHFKALTSALSATVGLGNIAGVAAAIAMGGPGAIFWMWLVAFFGMSMKFSSCSLSQMFRRVKDDGKILGGPMVYLDKGISSLYPSLTWLAKTFAILFSLFCVCAAFGGGNMFQGNQTYTLIAAQVYGDPDAAAGWLAWVVGIVLAITAALVLIGGLKRIGSVTSKMVPLMCGAYSLICLIILFLNVSLIPTMFAEIFIQAFSPDALIAGGFLGVFVTGMKRAAFSNEAGLGSAAIAHAAAKTKEPIREGVVAMLGPFIDTILVCTMTALTILVTEAHIGQGNGIELTRRAFASLGDWAPWLLLVIVIIFAYSTIISWSYYAERALEYLFGPQSILPYRILYVLAIVLGPLFTLQNVLAFSDLMLLSMAFPNIIGMILLSPVLAKKMKDYHGRLKSGAIHELTDAERTSPKAE